MKGSKRGGGKVRKQLKRSEKANEKVGKQKKGRQQGIKTPVEVEGTILKNTDAYLFELLANLMPMQKVHQIVDDNYLMSDLNNGIQEYAVYGNPTAKMFGIKYVDFLAYNESKYMGCNVVSGYMNLLEALYKKGGKNKFFGHQFLSV
jgi:hypothetical protein